MDELVSDSIRKMSYGIGIFIASMGFLDDFALAAILIGGCIYLLYNTAFVKLREAVRSGLTTKNKVILEFLKQPPIWLGVIGCSALLVLL